MSNSLGRWFSYGFGAAVGKALFGDGRGDGRETKTEPIRQQTEAEIREDEKRYDEDEKRLDAEAEKATLK
jgi:hypothetical protein